MLSVYVLIAATGFKNPVADRNTYFRKQEACIHYAMFENELNNIHGSSKFTCKKIKVDKTAYEQQDVLAAVAEEIQMQAYERKHNMLFETEDEKAWREHNPLEGF